VGDEPKKSFPLRQKGLPALQITCAETVVCLGIQAPSTGPGSGYLETAKHSRSIS